MNEHATDNDSGGMHDAFLTLGSNIDPEVHLPAAIRQLSQAGAVIRISPVYESRAHGDPQSANYLNAAVLLKTQLSPALLREQLRAIEHDLGRVRLPGNPNAPRTIDIDLVLYDRGCCEVDDRTIPDPEIRRRRYLAVPLADIAPEYVDPVTNLTLTTIAANLQHTAELTPRLDVTLSESVTVRPGSALRIKDAL